ncbi:hypothetical protein ACKWTF_013702 [Chironomus riparius]
MIFKCLFCQQSILDGDLVCATKCEHFIHDYCIDEMKSLGDHVCKNCNKITAVIDVYKEFDKAKATTIDGMTIIVDKLNELIGLIKSRENAIEDLTKKHDKISDRVDSLAIEHRAVKFLQHEMTKQINNLEHKNNGNNP